MGLPLRWFIACLLFAGAAGVMVWNKMTVCSWVRQKNPAATISIIGGALGAAGCLLNPVAWLSKLWWLPTALDIIGVPYLLVFAWIGIERWLKQPEG
jgi:H+/Cl- antiporter ClcA